MTAPSVLSGAALAREVLAADEKATPGPWGWPHNNALAGHHDGREDWHLVAAIHDAGPVQEADSDLIALYRTAAPALARHVEALTEALRGLRFAVRSMTTDGEPTELSPNVGMALTKADAALAAVEATPAGEPTPATEDAETSPPVPRPGGSCVTP